MPNIASFLKAEISRLARKEARGEVASLRKSSASHRKQIAALKRDVEQLQRLGKQIAKVRTASQPTTDSEPAGSKNRFSAKGLKSLRARLDLSAKDLSALLGASMQSVYNWETGKTVPRANQVAAIAALRGIGKREALRRLEAVQPPKAKRARKTKKS